MFSDFALGTVRRNARVGLAVPMQGQAQRGMMQSLSVAPNVQRLNANRAMNYGAPPPAAAQAVRAPVLGAPPLPQVAAPPAAAAAGPAMPPQGIPAGPHGMIPPGLAKQANPAVQAALAQIGAALMRK